MGWTLSLPVMFPCRDAKASSTVLTGIAIKPLWFFGNHVCMGQDSNFNVCSKKHVNVHAHQAVAIEAS
jgi:hypothetical protein